MILFPMHHGPGGLCTVSLVNPGRDSIGRVLQYFQLFEVFLLMDSLMFFVNAGHMILAGKEHL